MDKRIWTVTKKELKRIFTDKRLVFTTMILPALSIYLMYSLLGNMITNRIGDVEENIPKVVIIQGPESFKTYVSNNNLNSYYDFNWQDKLDQLDHNKDLVLEGDLELLLVFDDNFDQAVINFEKPNVNRFYNQVEDYSSQARFTMDEVLAQYENHLLGLRMGSPDLVEIFQVNKDIREASLHDDRKATGKGLSILFPMLIAIFLFSGAMSVGPDMIAGEKERGTMATLLVTPVKRETLVMGKVIALSIVAIVSSASSFIGIIASMPSAGQMFARDGINMSALKFGVKEYVFLGAIMLSLVGLYVSLVCLVSILSKSIKEANTYMAPIYMFVMISGFSTMYFDGTVSTPRFLILVYGSVMALKKLFAFELTTKMVLYTCGMSIILSFVIIYIIKDLFNNEKVMFSK